jgi:hypothetical protein
LLKRLSQDEYKAAMPSVKKQDVVCNISTAPLAKRGNNIFTKQHVEQCLPSTGA